MNTTQIMSDLSMYGVTNVSVNTDGACQNLHDLLIANYPCMRERLCTPFGDTTTFMIIVIILMVALFFVGYWLRGKMDNEETP